VVTLTAPAGATLSGVGAVYGTDDTAAVNSAVADAMAYAVNYAGTAGTVQVMFRNAIYCLGSAATLGGTTAGNAQIPLPPVSMTAGSAVRLEFTGVGGIPLPMWTQPQPVQGGTILLSMRNDGAVNATYGPPAVIGGPYDGYGDNVLVSNMHAVIDKITIVVPSCISTGVPAPYCGVDLFGLAECSIPEYAYLPLAVWEFASDGGTHSTVWPNLDGAADYPAFSFAFRAPTRGNNATVDCGIITSVWAQSHIVGNAHLYIRYLTTLYGNAGLVPGNPEHGAYIAHWNCQYCTYAIASVYGDGYGSGNGLVIHVGMLALEQYTYIVYDDSVISTGEILFEDLHPWGTYYSQLYSADGIPGIRLIAATSGPGVVTPPAVPATTVACPNYFYRDATVYIAGTMTGDVKIDGTSVGTLAAGAYRVPSGHSVTLTYSSAPTWVWVLE
jgi:hypothetical protein